MDIHLDVRRKLSKELYVLGLSVAEIAKILNARFETIRNDVYRRDEIADRLVRPTHPCDIYLAAFSRYAGLADPSRCNTTPSERMLCGILREWLKVDELTACVINIKRCFNAAERVHQEKETRASA